MIAAGFAAATAAFVTSRFGVAGTLLGAAVTAMIITGGSAILRGYLENVTGNVRKMPRKFQARRERRKAQRYGEPETLSERPDLRDNFAGRLRAALGWFSHLPPLARRSILVKGLIAAAVAFVIGMGAVWGVERVINNSLSCGFWANCPEGAKPGIHLNDEGQGANSTISLGRAKTKEGVSGGTGQPRGRSSGRTAAHSRTAASAEPFLRAGEPRLRAAARRTPRRRFQRSAGGGLFQPETGRSRSPPRRPCSRRRRTRLPPAPEGAGAGGAAPPGGAEEPGIEAQDASPAPAQ